MGIKVTGLEETKKYFKELEEISGDNNFTIIHDKETGFIDVKWDKKELTKNQKEFIINMYKDSIKD